MEVGSHSWVQQPDVCRCCLATNGTFDVTASVYSEGVACEVFGEMLFDCYGIKLSYLSERGYSRMMCDLCVANLRKASIFKKQVLAAERSFKDYITKVKIPIEISDKESWDDYGNNLFEPDPSDEDDKKSLNKYSGKGIKYTKNSKSQMELIFTSKGKIQKTKTENGGLALVKKNGLCDKDFMDHNELSNEEVNIKDATVKRNTVEGASQFKQLSERKRIVTTCETILRDTTACPFRHHKSWFQCFFCTQDFMEINTLREHTLNAHKNINEEIKNIKRFPRSLQIEISNLKCRHCDLFLTDVNELRGHFIDVHQRVIYKECIADFKVNGSPFTCHLCTKQFHVFRTLTTHLNEHYANCICDVCGKSFLNSKRLKVHNRTHEKGEYPCKKCNKILKSKSSEANHYESVHCKRVIKCQICFKSMKHYNERVKHMSLVHNITHKFVCPFCSREYNIKHYLATHIRQSHGNKNQKCLECGMAFMTKHGLKKHMSKHSAVKAYSCEICCKTYARNSTLKEHMRGHGTEKAEVVEPI